MRTRIIGALAITALVIAGCGSSSKTSTSAAPATTGAPSAVSSEPASSAATTAGPSAVVTTVAASTGATPAASSSAAPASSSSSAAAGGPACTGLGEAGAGAAVDLKLVEWGISGPATVKAGAVTLNITNGGRNEHNLAVVKGSTWETLPKSGSGGLDDSKLAPGALLGTASKLAGGKTCSTTLTLEAGTYVLLCTLGFGNNSHAARGQHFDLTVSS